MALSSARGQDLSGLVKSRQRNYYGTESFDKEDPEKLVKLPHFGICRTSCFYPFFVTVFLFPLNEFLRKIGHEPIYILMFIGRTGSIKSTEAALTTKEESKHIRKKCWIGIQIWPERFTMYVKRSSENIWLFWCLLCSTYTVILLSMCKAYVLMYSNP